MSVASATKHAKEMFVSTETLFRLVGDHYQVESVRQGRLWGDWEKFDCWVTSASSVFNVNEKVAREIGERCSERMGERFPNRDSKGSNGKGGGEEHVSPLVEKGGECYVWIRKPVRVEV